MTSRFLLGAAVGVLVFTIRIMHRGRPVRPLPVGGRPFTVEDISGERFRRWERHLRGDFAVGDLVYFPGELPTGWRGR